MSEPETKNRAIKVQFVFGRSSKMLRVTLAALIVFCMAALWAFHKTESILVLHLEDVRAQVTAIENDNSMLTKKIANVNTVQGMLDVAKEELDLISPDTVLFQTHAQ